jgi:hypothetical protein
VARTLPAAHRIHAHESRQRARAHGRPTGAAGEGEPASGAPFWRAWIGFDVQLWGDPDPLGQNPLLDFNSTVELYRELLGACYRNLGGAPNVQIGRFDWRQPSDDNRLGRLLVGHIAWGADITDEPFYIVPYANPGVPGTSVQVDLDVQSNNLDGSTTDAGTITFP